MDPISIALAKSGIPAAIQSATELMNRLFGPAAEESGLFLGDRVRSYRLRNMLKTLGRTQEMLNKAGIDPKSVPLRVLIPLLDGASLEDDEKLSTKWAALLANAAISREATNSSQIFSSILTQLSPIDALILDEISSVAYSFQSQERPLFQEYISFRGQIISDLKLQEDEYIFSIDNLRRLGLCIIDPPSFHVGVVNVESIKLIPRDIVVMTKLGYEFINACSAPC